MSNLGSQQGPIDPQFHDQMNALAGALDEMFNGPELPGLPRQKQVGFFLTCFPFNEPGRFNYISNADKLDVRAMLKEITARIEARLSPEGRA
jgi:hypothetical protein